MANQPQSPDINPPPPPSTPSAAPWQQMNTLINSLQELTGLLRQQQGGLGVISVGGGAQAGGQMVLQLPASFGPAGSTQQLINVMVENTPGAASSIILPYGRTIATETQDEEDHLVPFDAVITAVLVSFPAGCQQLVDTRLVYYGNKASHQYIVPSIDGSYVALDDTTVIFTPQVSIKAPGKLRVEWTNYDTLNTHKVPVIVTLKRTYLLS